MHVEFLDPFGTYPSLEESYGRMAALVAEHLAVQTDYEIDVSLVSEKEIRYINNSYRSKDAVTDVISFAFLDDTSPQNMILGEEGERMLGEILICQKRAEEQAISLNQSPERELLFLFLHGLLHLLGYDHIKKEDEERMFALQRLLMEKYEEKYGKR